MHGSRVLLFVLLGAIIISAAATAAWGSGSWLATGVVTKVETNALYMLGKDNRVYRVEVSDANIVSGDRDIRPGTTVRVFGRLTGKTAVCASRVRVLSGGQGKAPVQGSGPQKEVRIVVEKESAEETESAVKTEPPVGIPGPNAACGVPAAEPSSTTWQGKGLVMDIDFAAHQVKIQTSDGPFTINTDNAVMIRGTVRASLSQLNQGDTIWVAGNEVAPFVIDGKMIRLLRTYSEAQNAVASLPVSVVGVILQIDYPSRTFKMTGRCTTAVVSCDDNTVIQFQELKKTFSDLKPGTKINMSGYGNLNAGFAAQHIQIIGVSP